MVVERKELTKSVAKYLFTNGGLFLLVSAYVVGGAFLFKSIEYNEVEARSNRRINVSKQIEAGRITLAEQIWSNKSSSNFSNLVRSLMMDYHARVSRAMEDDGYSGYVKNASEFKNGWQMASALLFTITIVTTIGYGHVYPITCTGQITVIFYALAGVPLMLMFLANIGDLMARLFRVAYGRCCCYICWKKRKQNYEINRRRITDMRQSRLAQRAWTTPPGSMHDVNGHDNKAFYVEDTVHVNRPMSSPHGVFGDKQEPTRRRAIKSSSPADAKRDVAVWEPGSAPAYDIYEIIEDPDDEGIINVPISLTIVVIGAYLFLGAILFSTWNGWSWITGAYFSFVTLATIGFGDLVPGWDDIEHTQGKVKMGASIFYIVFGLAVLSMCFNLMMEEMISKFTWLGRRLGIIEDDPNSTNAKIKGSVLDDDKLFLVDKRSRLQSPGCDTVMEDVAAVTKKPIAQ